MLFPLLKPLQKLLKGELCGALYFSIPTFDLKNAGQLLYSAVCDQNKCCL